MEFPTTIIIGSRWKIFTITSFLIIFKILIKLVVDENLSHYMVADDEADDEFNANEFMYKINF